MACTIDLTGVEILQSRFQLFKFIATGLCLIANGEQMACDFDTIMAESACCDNDSEFTLLRKMAAAVCVLVESGGGGGGVPDCRTSTVPVAPPAAGECPVKFGIGDLAGFYFVFDGGFTNVWVQFPGGP